MLTFHKNILTIDGLSYRCKSCTHDYNVGRAKAIVRIETQIKCCSKCKKEKYLNEFSKDNLSKDGRRHICKNCAKLVMYGYQQKLQSTDRIIPDEHQCSKCDKVKSKDEFGKDKYNKNGLKHICKECEKIYRRERKRIRTDKDRATRRAKDKERLKSDHLFALKDRIRHNIKESIRRRGYSKKTKTLEILGCETWQFFYDYIESKFQKDMTWDDRSAWHLDHIIPISTAKTEKDVFRLNHYTNFQPLWKDDNIKKSNNIPDIVQFQLL